MLRQRPVNPTQPRKDPGPVGGGLGVWLVETVLSHPDLERLRLMLGTADAHSLYERYGFRPVDPGRMMERPRPD